MTIKEKLETIKGKKIAIWCFKEYEARIIHKYLDHIDDCFWDNYGTLTCYDYQTRLMYGNVDWYTENEFEVIPFRDFMRGIDLRNCLDVTLTQQDIAEILDKKYGKDNWGIK